MLDIIYKHTRCRYGHHNWVHNGSCIYQEPDGTLMRWEEYRCPYCGEVKHGERYPTSIVNLVATINDKT